MNANHTLPPLNPLKARSSIALGLTIITGICQIFGVDLFGFLSSLGLGGDQAAVLGHADGAVVVVNSLIEHGNEVILLLAPVWLWIERRAPNARLSFKNWFVRNGQVVTKV